MGMTRLTVAAEEGRQHCACGYGLFGKRDYSKINEHEGMVKCKILIVSLNLRFMEGR
ncbi:MAG: hypothetical protein ACLRXQ_00865 [Phascolarctobacterium faecium]